MQAACSFLSLGAHELLCGAGGSTASALAVWGRQWCMARMEACALLYTQVLPASLTLSAPNGCVHTGC